MTRDYFTLWEEDHFMDNKALIRRWIEGINKGDLAVVDEVFDPGLVAHEPDGDLRGTEVPRKIVIMFRTGFPDLLLTLEDLVAEGDRVTVRWTATGTHLGDFGGIAPTGAQVSFRGIYIYRIEGGRIAEAWPSRDELGLLRQLGAIPSQADPVGPTPGASLWPNERCVSEAELVTAEVLRERHEHGPE